MAAKIPPAMIKGLIPSIGFNVRSDLVGLSSCLVRSADNVRFVLLGFWVMLNPECNKLVIADP